MCSKNLRFSPSYWHAKCVDTTNGKKVGQCDPRFGNAVRPTVSNASVLLDQYSAQVWEWSIAIGLSVCVCLSASISLEPLDRPSRIFLQIPCVRGSVLPWQRCATLCTSGFMDDVRFGRSWPYGDAFDTGVESAWCLWMPC